MLDTTAKPTMHMHIVPAIIISEHIPSCRTLTDLSTHRRLHIEAKKGNISVIPLECEPWLSTETRSDPDHHHHTKQWGLLARARDHSSHAFDACPRLLAREFWRCQRLDSSQHYPRSRFPGKGDSLVCLTFHPTAHGRCTPYLSIQ